MIPLRDNVQAKSYPLVNISLIVLNVIALLVMWGSASTTIDQWCLVPKRFISHHDLGQFATLFSSMFMHAGILHLVGNMWFLWIFGDNVEDRLGHFEYLLFYLMCGMAGDFAHIILMPTSTIPSLGASGAIAGVLGGYLLLYPHAKIKMLFDDIWLWVYEWPAWLVIGGWWAMQYFLGVVVHDTASHVGYYAHLGGFAAGFIMIRWFAREEREPLLVEATDPIDRAYDYYFHPRQ